MEDALFELDDTALDRVHGGHASYGDGPCTRNADQPIINGASTVAPGSP